MIEEGKCYVSLILWLNQSLLTKGLWHKLCGKSHQVLFDWKGIVMARVNLCPWKVWKLWIQTDILAKSFYTVSPGSICQCFVSCHILGICFTLKKEGAHPSLSFSSPPNNIWDLRGTQKGYSLSFGEDEKVLLGFLLPQSNNKCSHLKVVPFSQFLPGVSYHWSLIDSE